MHHCEPFRPLLVGLLDGELTVRERSEINDHMIRCAACREEYERLRETSGKLEALSCKEPTDEVLRRLWRNPFSRVSRIGGILMVVLGYVGLIGFGLFKFFTGGNEEFWAKVPVAAIVIGVLVLFIRVVLERMKTYRNDPYKEIER